MCGYLGLGVFIFIIDRISKIAALAWCGESTHIINQFLSFELVFNRGVSWGMFHSNNDIIFIVVSLTIAIITAGFCAYAYQEYRRGVSIVGEVCIIAGSVCNLVDRVVYGGVIDFIVLSWGNISWPVFNIADAVIVLGVGILVFQYEK